MRYSNRLSKIADFSTTPVFRLRDVISLEFCQDILRQKTRFSGLGYHEALTARHVQTDRRSEMCYANARSRDEQDAVGNGRRRPRCCHLPNGKKHASVIEFCLFGHLRDVIIQTNSCNKCWFTHVRYMYYTRTN